MSRRKAAPISRSAFGGKADVDLSRQLCPLITMCGRLPVGKGFFTVMQSWSVLPCVRPVCAALLLGPLAIMLSADQVPIKSTQSRSCNG